MKDIITSILMLVIFTVVLGIGYPFAVWAISQTILPYEANGSLIEKDGKVVGSALIGQNFTSDRYFHGRQSAAGTGYDASASGGSNLGPTSKKLVERIQADAETLAAGNPGKPIPADLVTTSASGLDPHISPAAADFQVPRVAKARGMIAEDVRKLVTQFTEGRQLGFLGEPRINVLLLNLKLDEMPQANK
jgi:K+-transporting ATPase ATPase C chain